MDNEAGKGGDRRPYNKKRFDVKFDNINWNKKKTKKDDKNVKEKR